MLTIRKNEDCDKLVLESTKITEVFTATNDYLNIAITIDLNCCSTYELNISREDTATPFPPIGDDEIYIYNTTTNQLELDVNQIVGSIIDGIYKVTIVYSEEGGDSVIEANCAFIDCSTSCKVGARLQDLLDDDTDLHLIHYGLVNADNCGCNCDEMCELFRKLNQLLQDETKCM